MKSLFILLAICYHSIANPIDNIDLDLEQKRLEDYLTSMKDQTDLEVTPCDDFYQYACKSIHKKYKDNRDRSGRTFYAEKTNNVLMKEIFTSMEGTTHAEKVVKHYYNSCIEQIQNVNQLFENFDDSKPLEEFPIENYTLIFEQLDSTKALGKFPVDREPTDKELMNLMTDLVMVGQFGVIMPIPIADIDIDAKKLVLEPKNGIIIHAMRGFFRRDHLHWQMLIFRVPTNEQNLIKKQMIEFYSQLEDAAKIREEKTVEVENVEQLKEIAPDLDWNMFMELLQSKMTVPTDMLENIKIHDPNLLKRVTTILKNTDKKVLANFMIFKLVHLGYEAVCNDLMPFFRPMLYKKVLEQYVDGEDIAKHKVVFRDFEASLSIMKSALKKPEDEAVKEHLNKMKYLVTNHSAFFNEEYLDNCYKGYDLEKNMVFLNTWKLGISMIERMLKKIHNTEFVMDLDADVIMGNLDHMYNLNTHDMSIISYLITVTPHLWEEFFKVHPQYEISTAETCLRQQGMELYGDDIKKYLMSYTVNKVAYTDFMLKLIDIGALEENTKLLKKLGLKDFRQVYFIGMAQNSCKYGESSDGLLMKTFQHMEEFQEAFSCPADSPMNKLDEMKCDLENCDDFKEDSLHIVPYTNEKCMKTVSLNTILNPKANLEN